LIKFPNNRTLPEGEQMLFRRILSRIGYSR